MRRQRHATEESAGNRTAIDFIGTDQKTAHAGARVGGKTGLRGGGRSGQDCRQNAGDENVNMVCHGALRRIGSCL